MSNARISGHFVLALVCAPLLMGGACEPKKPTDTGAITAMDRAGSGSGAGTATDTSPLPGIDLSQLDAENQKRFYALVGSLKSPCGKTHSLRTSFTSDTSCKRAPYAVKYLAALLDEELSEVEVRDLFASKYEKASQPAKFDVSHAPRSGLPDAPIRLVEFFDYACVHCAQFKPILDKVIASRGKQVVLHYMMYPIEAKHPDSRSAAQAALAAAQQGKFHEMHVLLFERTPTHNRAAVMGYAAELALDIKKFEAAYEALGAQVTSDLKQGEVAGVNSTPTMFFNERKYEGPMSPKFIEMWIDEELAVNR